MLTSTFLCTNKGLNWKVAYRVGIITMAGACIGGIALGYFSQWVGRRRVIFGEAIISLFMILLYFQPGNESSLFASGFSRKFYIQGAWGVQIHLNELSHPSFRAFIPGRLLQLLYFNAKPTHKIGVTTQIDTLLAAPSAFVIIKIAKANEIWY